MNTSFLFSLFEREREMFYLTTHSTHFIYGYMASDIWLRTIVKVRKETHCRHIGFSYRLTKRVLLYAPSHRQDNTYHGLCYTSRGALAGTRNSSMGPPHEGSIRWPIAPWANTLPLSSHYLILYLSLNYVYIFLHEWHEWHPSCELVAGHCGSFLWGNVWEAFGCWPVKMTTSWTIVTWRAVLGKVTIVASNGIFCVGCCFSGNVRITHIFGIKQNKKL